ncbi:hypothetical protein ABBQ32_004200 [Trebouxia sp. C0010 RCD-2024]
MIRLCDSPLAMRGTCSFSAQTETALLGRPSILRSLWPNGFASRPTPGLLQHKAWSNISAALSCQSTVRRSHATRALLAEAAPPAPAAQADQPVATVPADTVLVVESKTKAIKIQKFLGPSYKVEVLKTCVQTPQNDFNQNTCSKLGDHLLYVQVVESQGHVRDLDAKAGSVDPANNFSMTWSINDKAQVKLDRIKQALKHDSIKRLVLATDPDREGEAIAWHLKDILQACNSAHDASALQPALRTQLASQNACFISLLPYT